jgi:hypothetical protein
MNEIMPTTPDSTPDEIWKPIPNYEDYDISNTGRIWRERYQIKRRPQFIKQRFNKHGYLRVCLYKKGKKRHFFVHRLVGFAFIPPVAGKEDINHKNGQPADNRSDNLEWCTQSENMTHAYRVLGIPVSHGEAHTYAKLKEADIPVIRQLVSEGKTYGEVASLFSVSFTAIRMVVIGRNWKHVTKAIPLNITRTWPHGENHPRAKLKESNVLEIRAMHKAGWRIIDIAAKYSVSVGPITGIIHGKIWKHVI